MEMKRACLETGAPEDTSCRGCAIDGIPCVAVQDLSELYSDMVYISCGLTELHEYILAIDALSNELAETRHEAFLISRRHGWLRS